MQQLSLGRMVLKALIGLVTMAKLVQTVIAFNEQRISLLKFDLFFYIKLVVQK